MFSTVSRPNPHGTPVRSATSWMPRAASCADVVVVARLAADDGAEAGDAVVAPGLGGHERGERQLERAGHVEDVDGLRPGRLEEPRRPLHEPLGELLVEARDDDREPHGVSSPARWSRSSSSWSISLSTSRPWWCSVWPRRSRLARR